MGVAVVGGMTFATVFGIFLIPAFYVITANIVRFFNRKTGGQSVKSSGE